MGELVGHLPSLRELAWFTVRLLPVTFAMAVAPTESLPIPLRRIAILPLLYYAQGLFSPDPRTLLLSLAVIAMCAAFYRRLSAVRGARTYFCKIRRTALKALDFFVEQRVARWSARKHARRFPDWSLIRGAVLYRQYGLELMNLPRARRPPPSRRAT